MKKYLLLLSICFSGFFAIAQDIHLSDSVIYNDNKPVAYYVKELNESSLRYNVYIISLNKELLIAAQVVKFEAPVMELKPFYYYDVIFQKEKDTFAIYHEGQAFTLELASLIQRYKLLDGNKINKNSLVKFKKEYSGNASLKAKIKEYETYLNDNRFLNEQTARDRTKPVIILNDKIIMQDGKKIGMIVTNTSTEGQENNNFTFRKVNNDHTMAGIPTNGETAGPYSYNQIQVLLPTNRVVDASPVLIDPPSFKTRKNKDHLLFQASLPFNKTASNENYLWGICQLVENYLL